MLLVCLRRQHRWQKSSSRTSTPTCQLIKCGWMTKVTSCTGVGRRTRLHFQSTFRLIRQTEIASPAFEWSNPNDNTNQQWQFENAGNRIVYCWDPRFKQYDWHLRLMCWTVLFFAFQETIDMLEHDFSATIYRSGTFPTIFCEGRTVGIRCAVLVTLEITQSLESSQISL